MYVRINYMMLHVLYITTGIIGEVFKQDTEMLKLDCVRYMYLVNRHKHWTLYRYVISIQAALTTDPLYWSGEIGQSNQQWPIPSFLRHLGVPQLSIHHAEVIERQPLFLVTGEELVGAYSLVHLLTAQLVVHGMSVNVYRAKCQHSLQREVIQSNLISESKDNWLKVHIHNARKWVIYIRSLVLISTCIKQKFSFMWNTFYSTPLHHDPPTSCSDSDPFLLVSYIRKTCLRRASLSPRPWLRGTDRQRVELEYWDTDMPPFRIWGRNMRTWIVWYAVHIYDQQSCTSEDALTPSCTESARSDPPVSSRLRTNALPLFRSSTSLLDNWSSPILGLSLSMSSTTTTRSRPIPTCTCTYLTCTCIKGVCQLASLQWISAIK